MPQQKGTLVENTFGQGLFTEATGLNFPKDAASDVLNVVFNQDMSITRRLGLDWETNSIQNAISFFDTTNTYIWKNVSNISDLQFYVSQVGNKVYIYRMDQTTTISTNLIYSLDLETQRVVNAPPTNTKRVQFAEGNGKLFIAHPYCYPIAIDYNGGTSFTPTSIVVVIRDFEGVDDGIDPTTKPLEGQLSVQHLYNLYNQGWSVTAPCGTDDKVIGPSTYVLDYWRTKFGLYPSNIDYWWAGKDALGQLNERYVNVKALGNSLAPKGHYYYDAFNMNRSQNTEVQAGAVSYSVIGAPSDLPTTSSSFYRPSVIAFFAGRIFYSGVNYSDGRNNFGNRIYFSRIIERPQHYGQCYQDNDPTAEEGSDLLPSDGGVIQSPEIGTIYKLFAIGYSLMIFASNGIWTLSGSTGTGFTAKDYSIAKVSAQGCLSDTSFVDVDGSPVWWGSTGIFGLTSSDSSSNASSGVSVQSLTDDSIKTFFKTIDNTSKYYAQGCYNREANTIYWLYNQNAYQYNFGYNDVLVLNTKTKAFTRWNIPSFNQVYGISCLMAKGYPAVVKLNAAVNTMSSFAEFKSTNYIDWSTFDYPSYVETGHTLQGHAVAKFWTPYVFVYLANDGGQLNFYHKWNFSSSPDTGKYSNFQTVETTQGYDTISIRKKVRGSGRALKIRFESITGQPFTLIGWAALVSTNSGP